MIHSFKNHLSPWGQLSFPITFLFVRLTTLNLLSSTTYNFTIEFSLGTETDGLMTESSALVRLLISFLVGYENTMLRNTHKVNNVNNWNAILLSGRTGRFYWLRANVISPLLLRFLKGTTTGASIGPYTSLTTTTLLYHKSWIHFKQGKGNPSNSHLFKVYYYTMT